MNGLNVHSLHFSFQRAASCVGLMHAGTLRTNAQEKFAVCVYPNITRSVSECWQADQRMSFCNRQCVPRTSGLGFRFRNLGV